ncbi:GntR family transcriptional regulator [Desulfitobacterium sp. Sab5]|uniref:GntR family transcriptional regulator n=1 Tax=Desulfitobacterium nosdiversum TaxID=3375356 RepID=UPI003CF255E4
MAQKVEIVDWLIAQIASGEYKAHDKLPSENKITDLFKVPRITVRKAYERLEELGFIYKKQGKGSYVKDRSQQIELVLSGDVSFTQKMEEKGYNLQTKNVFCKPIKYNPKIYDYLEVEANDVIYKVGRLRLIDHQPIAIHISYIAKSVFADIDEVGMELTSMFHYFQTRGFTEFNSKPSILSITFPTKSQRSLFHCSQLIPFLVLESGCTDKISGKVLEYRKIYYRSDCFSYTIPSL